VHGQPGREGIGGGRAGCGLEPTRPRPFNPRRRGVGGRGLTARCAQAGEEIDMHVHRTLEMPEMYATGVQVSRL
jgi:hypothetical protein